MNQNLDPKYRITVSLSQLDYLIETLSEQKGDIASDLLKSFKKLAAKSQLGIVSAAYVAKKKQSISESLGVSEAEQRYLNGEMTEEEEIEFQNSLLRI